MRCWAALVRDQRKLKAGTCLRAEQVAGRQRVALPLADGLSAKPPDLDQLIELLAWRALTVLVALWAKITCDLPSSSCVPMVSLSGVMPPVVCGPSQPMRRSVGAWGTVSQWENPVTADQRLGEVRKPEAMVGTA